MEEQAQPEPAIRVQAAQPPVPAKRRRTKLPWPHGSGLPGFGAYTGKKWYNSDTEEQDENDDPPRPRRSFPVPKYKDRHLENEQPSDSKLSGDTSDSKPSVSGTAAAADEEQAALEPTSEPPPETSIPLEPEQPSVPARKRPMMKWPPRDGLPGYGMHRGRMYYTEYEDHVEHHAEPRPRRSFPVPKYEDRHSEPEPISDSKLPGDIKDDKSPEGDKEQHSIGETEGDRRRRNQDSCERFLSSFHLL